jgi:hypothetical protein
MLRWIGLGAGGLMVVGLVVVFTADADTTKAVGGLIFFAALIVEAICAAISALRRIKGTFDSWHDIFRGGPHRVRIVSIEPPQGVIFNHDATVTLEIEGQGGAKKQVQREVPVPRMQALLWRLGQRLPFVPQSFDFGDRIGLQLRKKISSEPNTELDTAPTA